MIYSTLNNYLFLERLMMREGGGGVPSLMYSIFVVRSIGAKLWQVDYLIIWLLLETVHNHTQPF